GESLMVLDESLEPVPAGEIGDLYIGGAGLSPGYWRDEEKTREVFVHKRCSDDRSERIYKTGDLASVGEDGLVFFAGRSDCQIKTRGYRIELGEIESALHSLEGLRECAVVAVTLGGFEGACICCAYVPITGHCTGPLTLRKELGRLLPSYMLPTHWLEFHSLP